MGITDVKMKQVSDWMIRIIEVDNDREDERNFYRPKPRTNTLILIEKFLITYGIFTGAGEENAKCYSCCVSTMYNVTAAVLVPCIMLLLLC